MNSFYVGNEGIMRNNRDWLGEMHSNHIIHELVYQSFSISTNK